MTDFANGSAPFTSDCFGTTDAFVAEGFSFQNALGYQCDKIMLGMRVNIIIAYCMAQLKQL